MTEIPEQLRNPAFRFLRYPAGEKYTTAKGWNDVGGPNYSWDALEIKTWRGNVGLLLTPDFSSLIDVECERSAPAWFSKKCETLPPTFTFRSGGGSIHRIYRAPGFGISLSFQPLGEIIAAKQVVIPPSIHESGLRYVVVSDLPIADITKAEIAAVIGPYMTASEPLINKNGQPPEWAKKTDFIEFPISKLISTADFTDMKNSEYQGTHPGHGSTSEWNFRWNDFKNLWFCYRDNAGGDGLNLLAQISGLISCGDKLDGDNFLKTLEIAKEKYGFELPQAAFDKETAVKNNLSLPTYRKFSMADLDVLDTHIDMLIDPFLPAGITIIGGSQGAGKSILALFFAMHIATGKDIFGSYKVAKKRVCYVDTENSEKVAGQRFQMFKKNYGFENVPITDFSLISALGRELKDIIKNEEFDVIFLDSLRRFLPGDENKSENTDRFYSEILKPLKDAGKSVIILAHAHKTRPDIEAEDVDNKIRGSSDITAQPELILFMVPGAETMTTDKINKEISVLRGKNRLGLHLQNFTLELIKDDTTGKSSIVFKGFFSEQMTEEKIRAAARALLKSVESMERKDIIIAVQEEMFKNASIKPSEPTIDRALKTMLKLGEVMKPKAGTYKLVTHPLDEFG